MSAGVRDYRPLVSRKPPEGLREWTLKTFRSELDRHGLVYEVDYDDMFCDWPMAIPEGYKRTKMVRVTCSCCGDSMLLNWGTLTAIKRSV